MSPKNKRSKKTTKIVLPPLEIDASGNGTNSAEYQVDPQHAAALDEHIKTTLGGSLVSVCL